MALQLTNVRLPRMGQTRRANLFNLQSKARMMVGILATFAASLGLLGCTEHGTGEKAAPSATASATASAKRVFIGNGSEKFAVETLKACGIAISSCTKIRFDVIAQVRVLIDTTRVADVKITGFFGLNTYEGFPKEGSTSGRLRALYFAVPHTILESPLDLDDGCEIDFQIITKDGTTENVRIFDHYK